MEEMEKDVFPDQNLYMKSNIFSFKKCLFCQVKKAYFKIEPRASTNETALMVF